MHGKWRSWGQLLAWCRAVHSNSQPVGPTEGETKSRRNKASTESRESAGDLRRAKGGRARAAGQQAALAGHEKGQAYGDQSAHLPESQDDACSAEKNGELAISIRRPVQRRDFLTKAEESL